MAWRRSASGKQGDRLKILQVCLTLVAVAVAIRVGWLQIYRYGFYAALAEDQHQLSQQLLPTRGEILVHDDQSTSGTYPLATNRTLHFLYAVPQRISDPVATAEALRNKVSLPYEDLLQRLSKENDLYEPIEHNVTDERQADIAALRLAGIEFSDETSRYYPEKEIGSQVLGFVGFDGDKRVGRYGIEGSLETILAGKQGTIQAEKDANGQLIASAAQLWQPAVDGSDVVLTLNRAIQYEACKRLDSWVEQHGASGGSVVILEPKTGAVIAMCGAPDFDPNSYRTVDDIGRFLNPSTQVPYEPGSVFKPLTMAAALDQGKVTPETTYRDTGEVKIDSFTIKNSDLKAHGVQTMNQVLQESLNTGAIFSMQQIGNSMFEQYTKNFGFGAKTKIEVPEAGGNISALETGKDIYAMTGSFGQGITVTPLQLATAYAALANGGKLLRPYIIDTIRHQDGTETKTAPETVRQVISAKSSSTISAMLVNVVERGHGKRAGVPGYYVAGKTGTAQIPDPNGSGYLKNTTIGTFAGYAPVEDPRFVMVVKVDRPKDVQYAESSAAPLFGQLAKFLLSYYQVAPNRE